MILLKQQVIERLISGNPDNAPTFNVVTWIIQYSGAPTVLHAPSNHWAATVELLAKRLQVMYMTDICHSSYLAGHSCVL
jgi:hypothetical protein